MIGLVVGVVVGMTSTGGGALLTPALVLIMRISPALAVGSDVFIATVMKMVGGGFYAIRGAVHWPTVVRLAVGSAPGAVIGVAILNHMPAARLDGMLQRTLGGVLMLSGLAMLARMRFAGRLTERPMPRAPITTAFGLLTGLLVSTTSVGSGTIVLCFLGLFFPLAARTMVGTDLMHALLLTGVASIGHLWSGRVDIDLALSVLTGAIPGVVLGVRMTSIFPERLMRSCLALLLIGVGIHMTGAVTAFQR
jgi:uncharacterized membrane protein YfcA